MEILKNKYRLDFDNYEIDNILTALNLLHGE